MTDSMTLPRSGNQLRKSSSSRDGRDDDVMASWERTIRMPGLKGHGSNFKSREENEGEVSSPQS